MANSTWQVEVDHSTSVEWSQMLDLFDDANIYQTAAYGEVRWGEKNLSRLVLKNDGDIAGLAQLRVIRPTPFKYGLAYLRWGPLWERSGRPLNPEVPSRMAEAIEDEYVKKRGLFVLIIPNAFVDSVRADVFQRSFLNIFYETDEANSTYRTFVIDLRPSLEELRRRLDKKWRNQLTHSEKNHLTVIAGNGPNEYQTFCDIYNQMRKRKAFDTTVDVDEFGRIHEALIESQRLRVLICLDKGIPIAGLIVSTIGDCAIYMLGATSDVGMKSKGSYLLQWKMICWLKERGIKSYDLGGIDPVKNPGVFHFKKGLAGVDTYQIKPLNASASVVSSWMAKACMILHRTILVSSRPMNSVHTIN